MCRTVDLRQAVLARNDSLAAALRAELRAAGTSVVNLLSSPGSGKTALLEEVLGRAVGRGLPVAALTADLATENDARRLARSGAPVKQVTTGGLCHLEAGQLRAHLTGWLPPGTRALFVENVGNLVCPACYDLGETLRVTLMSVTEGEDKPAKYPTAFGLAHLVVLTKTDLAAATGFDDAAFEAEVRRVNPGAPILRTSARTGEGVEALLDRVEAVCAGEPPHVPLLAGALTAAYGHEHAHGDDAAHEPGHGPTHDAAHMHRTHVPANEPAHVHRHTHEHTPAYDTPGAPAHPHPDPDAPPAAAPARH
jgi:hydrogenase nickel incorporation protein HypB